jgi:hypothetical protein
MSLPSVKTFKATLEPDGLGVGWSNPILVDQMGRSGEVVSLEVRGDPTDATTGTATLMLFEAPIPKNPADYIDAPGIVDVAKLDPATIPDGDQALRIVGLTIAPSATVSSDKVNVRDQTTGAAVYAVSVPSNALFLAISGVTGKVNVVIRAQGQ